MELDKYVVCSVSGSWVWFRSVKEKTHEACSGIRRSSRVIFRTTHYLYVIDFNRDLQTLERFSQAKICINISSSGIRRAMKCAPKGSTHHMEATTVKFSNIF